MSLDNSTENPASEESEEASPVPDAVTEDKGEENAAALEDKSENKIESVADISESLSVQIAAAAKAENKRNESEAMADDQELFSEVGERSESSNLGLLYVAAGVAILGAAFVWARSRKKARGIYSEADEAQQHYNAPSEIDGERIFS